MGLTSEGVTIVPTVATGSIVGSTGGGGAGGGVGSVEQQQPSLIGEDKTTRTKRKIVVAPV